jgi:multisubunit Na+/H+ antiporter MnhB subunit
MSIAHVASNRAKLLNAFKTHGWISFSAGASVAYVFVHVFPEIGIYQQHIAGNTGHHQPVSFINQPLYLAALGGLCFLYLLDTIEEQSYDENSSSLQARKYNMTLFSVRSVLYVLYNIMIAYIITQRPGEGLMNIFLIAIALILHFIVANIRAHERYGELYEKYMRWPAAGGLISGWFLGVIIDLPDVITVTIFSLIGGMITYIALKSELPQTGHKAPYHFFAGAFIYALIVLAIPFFGLSHLSHK